MFEQANPNPASTERSQAAVALDNLIRRHLRVSDPGDPDAISKALRERYSDASQALDQEAAGLPFFKVTRIDTPAPVDGSSSRELRQDHRRREHEHLAQAAALRGVGGGGRGLGGGRHGGSGTIPRAAGDAALSWPAAVRRGR